MRLFVSIDLPEQTREEIQSWMPDLKGWKKSSVSQMHLTLAFLGECSKAEKVQIIKELGKVEFEPFEMIIEGLGAFPNRLSPRILWAGVQRKEKLLMLHERVLERVSGYEKSNQPDKFVPHITLARKKTKRGDLQTIKETIRNETVRIHTVVESFQLKRSMLRSEGSEHETLCSYS